MSTDTQSLADQSTRRTLPDNHYQCPFCEFVPERQTLAARSGHLGGCEQYTDALMALAAEHGTDISGVRKKYGSTDEIAEAWYALRERDSRTMTSKARSALQSRVGSGSSSTSLRRPSMPNMHRRSPTKQAQRDALQESVSLAETIDDLPDDLFRSVDWKPPAISVAIGAGLGFQVAYFNASAIELLMAMVMLVIGQGAARGQISERYRSIFRDNILLAGTSAFVTYAYVTYSMAVAAGEDPPFEIPFLDQLTSWFTSVAMSDVLHVLGGVC